MNETASSPLVVALGEALMLITSAPGTNLLHSALIRASFVGAESNLAIGLARLGHRVRWLSVLGQDLFGEHILKTLRGEGVDVARVIQSNAGPTALMIKNRRAGMEPEIFYYRSTSAMSRADAGTFAPDAWRDAKILYLTGITPALSDSCREMFERILDDAKDRGIEIWFDPNYRSKLWPRDKARQVMLKILPKVDVVLAGADEGELLTGHTDPKSIAAALLAMGPKQIVVKSGQSGSYSFSRDAQHFAPAIAIDRVIDPIGAGDAFAAGYLSATLDGVSPKDALHRGNLLGAIVCQTDGDWEGLPTRADLDHHQRGRLGSAR